MKAEAIAVSPQLPMATLQNVLGSSRATVAQMAIGFNRKSSSVIRSFSIMANK